MDYTYSLAHHGIKGQKWGVRRFQNDDGTLTEAGKKRYEERSSNENNTENSKKLSDKQKKILIAAGITAGVAVTAYGAYKVSKIVKNKKAIKVGEEAAKKALQNEYLMKNIANTQSHIDPTSSVRNSEKYQHAYRSTLNSRNSSITGDRKLLGPKYVEGRNASKEAKNFVDNAKAYQMHRGGMYGYGWKGDIEKNTSKSISELNDLTQKLLKQNGYLLR